MDLDEYQDLASATDQVPSTEGDGIVVPLLGIAGEAGALLVEYKKRLRDGPAYTAFDEQVSEELGDIMWYVANLASKSGLSLSAIAKANLWKTTERWGEGTAREVRGTMPLLFDEAFPETEQLPRQMTATITGGMNDQGIATASLDIDGRTIGNELNDNAMVDDGYRFHDAIHLAHVAMLGWSPTIRGLMKRKRKSVPTVDHGEDGARAIVVDEGVVEMIFDYARRRNFLDGVGRVDYELLKSVKRRTAGLEVSARSPAEWEQAILESYRLWRHIRANGGGRFKLDLIERQIELL